MRAREAAFLRQEGDVDFFTADPGRLAVQRRRAPVGVVHLGKWNRELADRGDGPDHAAVGGQLVCPLDAHAKGHGPCREDSWAGRTAVVTHQLPGPLAFGSRDLKVEPRV